MKHYTHSIDEVAYLLCRGAKRVKENSASDKGKWFVYYLKHVNSDHLRDFADTEDRSVSVAEFLHRRNQLKFELSEMRQNDYQKQTDQSR